MSKNSLPDLNWRETQPYAGALAKHIEMRNRLHQRGETVQRARQKAGEAERLRLLAEVAQATGKGSKAEYDMAAGASTEAKTELDALHDTPDVIALNDAIVKLGDELERLENEAVAAAKARLRPYYVQAVRDVVKALEQLRDADKNLMELRVHATAMFGIYVMDWPYLGDTEQRLKSFTQLAQAVGLMD